jgi:hypothetical protein
MMMSITPGNHVHQELIIITSRVYLN